MATDMRKIFLPHLAASLAASLLAASVSNAADTDMRPGLWELTTTSDLLKLVPYIQPDQMQQLRELARQHGFDMPKIQNGAASSRVCITPEMAQQKIPPHFYHDQSGCTSRDAARTGDNYKMSFVCEGPELKGTGTAEGKLTSPESFAGSTRFDGAVRDIPVNERAEISGRWIAASCGAAKRQQ